MSISPPILDALRQIVGPKGWIDEAADMAPYLVEERGLYQGETDAIVRPASTEEVAKVMGICHEAAVPVVPQGGNTGLCGGGVPAGGIVLSLGRMKTIRTLDPLNKTITVEAGAVLADIQQAAAEAGALFPLSLGAEGTCQIGGNLSTNAGGVGVLRYGNARDLVLGLEVVLPDGRLWDGLRGLRKDNTGYDLKHLFIGAEGTLGIITAAVLKLFPTPVTRVTALTAGSDLHKMMALFSRLQDAFVDGLTACELMSRTSLEFGQRHIPGIKDPFETPHNQYVLIELTSPRLDDGMRESLEDILGQAFDNGLTQDAVIATSESQAEALWRIRETIPEAQKHEGGSIKHDVAVPVSSVADFIEQASILVEAEMDGIRVCAFGHLGDGNIHFNLSQPTGMDKQAFLDQWGRFNKLVHDLVVSMYGSFSAEHGIGQLKRGEMERYKSSVELDLMRTLKKTLDPKNIMNPGKIL